MIVAERNLSHDAHSFGEVLAQEPFLRFFNKADLERSSVVYLEAREGGFFWHAPFAIVAVPLFRGTPVVVDCLHGNVVLATSSAR